MAGQTDIRDEMKARLAKRQTIHEERMAGLLQEEIGSAEVPPATCVSHFLERLNAEDDA